MTLSIQPPPYHDRVNAELTGTVRMAGDIQPGVRVEIHLDQEVLRLVSPHGELGAWPLAEVGVSARVDGFHLRLEGEEIVLSTNDDARFAMALGLRSTSSPRLNRLLATARDEEVVSGPVGPAVETLLPPAAPASRSPGTSPVAVGIVGAAAVVLVGALLAVGTGSPLRLFGLLPAWPVSALAALALAAGGFALLLGMKMGRVVVAVGIALGLSVLIGSFVRTTVPSWISDGVLLVGVGIVLAGLLLAVDRLNES
jgi:hypothetical protein